LALDRQDIERRDFPIGRRGYEPEAVDAHLRRVAEDLDELRRADRPSTASLASSAADQVRSIVEAAETTASDIKHQAEDEASGTRSRAEADAEKTRADAADQARGHVVSVQEATQAMLQRVDAMESELGALVESLRTGANRLTADLTLLTGNMGELRGAATGSGADTADEATEPVSADEATEPVSAPPPKSESESESESDSDASAEDEAAAEGSDDSEGARLIALNMALNGTPREETDRYLADNFQLEDREKLLDEVYARVG
jgi:DivIVA domain-containing protein